MSEQAKQTEADAAEAEEMFGEPKTGDDSRLCTRITVIEKNSGILSKSISLGPDGQPVSDSSGCFLAEGQAAPVTVTDAAGLKTIIDALSQKQALTLGVPAGVPDGDSIAIVSKRLRALKRNQGATTRTKPDFAFTPGQPGILLIDTDLKGLSREVRAKLDKVGGAWAAIADAVPGLARAMRTRRLSTSAGLSANGVVFPHSGGEHNYVFVADSKDVPRATQVLHERLLLAGYGNIWISDGGAMLERSVADAYTGSPERLVFEGAPRIVAPLVQSGRDAEVHEGDVVDTLKALPDLDVEEKRKLRELVAAMKLLATPEAKRIRTARNRTIAEEWAKKTGEKVEDIMARLASRFEGRLPDEQPLVFDDAKIGTVTVGDVLDDPDRYVGQTLGDPLEPEYGRCKAQVWRGHYGDIMIHSFAHGDHDFVLGDGSRAFDEHPIDWDEVERSAAAAWACAETWRRKQQQKRGAAWNEKTFRGPVKCADLLGFAPSGTFIHRPTREMWPASTVDKRLPRVRIGNVGKNGKEITVSASMFIMRDNAVEQMTWLPGGPEILENTVVHEGGIFPHKGMRVYNRYRAPVHEPGDPAGAERWRQHLCKVFPVPGDAEHIEFYLAHAVQKPGEKVNHSLLLGGEPGIGKDTVLVPVRYAVGGWNFQEIVPTALFGRFNGYMMAVLLRINEVHDLGEKSIYDFCDRLKSVQVSPPEMLRIDEKYLPEHHIPNVAHIVLTSNHKQNGLYLPVDDRRHYVAWSPLKENEPGAAYFNGLYRWLDIEGNRHVAAYLRQLDISGFDVAAPPRKTQAFWEIVNSNRSEGETGIGDLIEAMARDNDGRPPDVLTIADLLAAARDSGLLDVAEWLGDRKHRRTVPVSIERNGYIAVANPDAKDGLWRIDGRRQAVYRRYDLSPKEAIRAAMKRANEEEKASKSSFAAGDDVHDDDEGQVF